ncbi:hypothetical protein DSM106972_076830 [Dulcicalothrix desertica PCC 7102]|uniref:Uncharacterized protein n=1 Tax=Dulcicalothrix desertica PCC 7102 TaxID=232991 RepID=A0A3S1CCR9_9CYAN|nr:hypothetical protein [Dulcicalothrix desertica]RUT00235.1 hypothetical protein DSM106972_076830 [Dulcicalothrix desertica PCC 7102]TWH55702.1 hypothetical protein CAL7102_03866 [Dulcicalothrix desertica PCC 7102]
MQEFYASTTYYGIGEIIKRYASFPLFLPCPIAIQHGWNAAPTKHDARFDVPENWYWSALIEKKYHQEFNGLSTRSVGAPFLYLLKLIKYSPLQESQRSGSIVFPSHSSKYIKMECDFEEYADMLCNLPDEYKPITICMYHLDQEKGLDKPFLDKGFEVVNNGNSIYDVDFLNNFIANTRGKKYAFSNQMSSALLFASIMGLSSFFYGPHFQTDCKDPNNEHMDYTQYHRDWEAKYADYFKFNNCNIEEQKMIASIELGEEHILSPLKMNLILWWLTLNKLYLKLIALEVKKSIKSLIKKIPFVHKVYVKTMKITSKNYI